MKKTVSETKNAAKNSAPPRKRIRAGHILLLILASALAVLIVSAIISIIGNRNVTVANYTVASEKLESSLRIVLVSDLHREEFGKDNQGLVDLIAAQEPDLIVLDGDMIEGNYTDEEGEAYRYLIERLMKTAPVYFSMGNHDGKVYSESVELVGTEIVGIVGRSELLDSLESTGGVFLESDYRDVNINGDRLRIGGFYSFAWRYQYDTDESWAKREAFLSDYCDTDDFKLMLSHRPNSFIYGDAGSTWDVDLVLSGHTHNGLISTPITHRAIWTSEGFFPDYTYGEFDLGRIKLIVSSGLAGWRFLPRVFNPPEIAVIDLVPGD